MKIKKEDHQDQETKNVEDQGIEFWISEIRNWTNNLCFRMKLAEESRRRILIIKRPTT